MTFKSELITLIARIVGLIVFEIIALYLELPMVIRLLGLLIIIRGDYITLKRKESTSFKQVEDSTPFDYSDILDDNAPRDK